MNWESSVELPERVVPLANAVTRLFWNEASADRLLGVSPSVLRVLKAVLIAVNWPTVVLDFAWIAWMSLRSVWTAVLTAVFVVEFVEPRAEVSELVLAWATSELVA